MFRSQVRVYIIRIYNEKGLDDGEKHTHETANPGVK